MRWIKPDFEQTEQLQDSATTLSGRFTAKPTSPQWHSP
jgi:hypothetical protein